MDTHANMAARAKRNFARAVARKVCPVCGDTLEIVGGSLRCSDPECDCNLDKTIRELDAQASYNPA
jgi:hypothetical protein